MDSSGNKSIISKNPPWLSSVATSAFSLILPFLFVGVVSVIGMFFDLHNEVLGNFIAYLCTGIAVAIMCFLICKAHPKSIWYTPLICNAITLLSGLGNYIEGSPFFNEALPFGIGWILSIIASIWGASIGRHAKT
jgi:hypothetical protein